MLSNRECVEHALGSPFPPPPPLAEPSLTCFLLPLLALRPPPADDARFEPENFMHLMSAGTFVPLSTRRLSANLQIELSPQSPTSARSLSSLRTWRSEREELRRGCRSGSGLPSTCAGAREVLCLCNRRPQKTGVAQEAVQSADFSSSNG